MVMRGTGDVRVSDGDEASVRGSYAFCESVMYASAPEWP